jgi:hypothetical protein
MVNEKRRILKDKNTYQSHRNENSSSKPTMTMSGLTNLNDPRTSKNLDTKRIVANFSKFIKAKGISKAYIGKCLNVSRAYLVEVLQYPIEYEKLTKKGKLIYVQLNEILKNDEKRHQLVYGFKKCCKQSTTRNQKDANTPVKQVENVFFRPANKIFNEPEMPDKTSTDDDDCMIIDVVIPNRTKDSSFDYDDDDDCEIINIPFIF